MAFEYIKPDELKQTYEDAKKFMLPLHQPFEEFERISRNKPHPGIDKSLPKVTDGTLAGLIKEQPKRVIQQIPTGKVKATEPWLEVAAGFILTHEILPNAESVASLIQKCWSLVSKALTYGSQPVYVQFLNRGEYFGTDFTLPYIKDVFLEPGKISDLDSNVIFLRTWWTKNQLQRIIEKEDGLASRAKQRGDEYKSGWDLEMLNDLIEEKPSQKDANAATPTEKGKMLNAGFYEIVHVFQRGIDACFYSFDPRRPDGDNILRTRKNKDPRGAIPIHFMYADQDFSNPLGRGSVELSGGLQNLLDSEVQMYQYNRALMLNPPLVKKGNYPKSRIKFSPNHVIDLGADANASLEALDIDTTAIQNFASNYGLIKSQILNLNSSTDTSVSSEVGNPGFSKTDAGVKSTEAKLGISDNYMRKQFESTWRDICETMINLWFAERQGVQELQLDQETADKLSQVAPEGTVDENNMIRIDYTEETPKLQFMVDAGSSEEEDDQQQLESLQNMITEMAQDPLISYRLTVDGYKVNLGEAYMEAFERSGIKSIHKIITEMTPEEKKQAAQTPMPMIDKPKLSVAFDDVADIPEAMQGILSNAGVDLPITVFQQAVATKQQAEAAANAPEQPSNDISNHPVVKLMESLQIKFESLDATAQQAILAQLGIPSDGNTPTAVDQNLKTNQQQIDAAKVDQQATDSANAHTIAAADTAVKIADLAHRKEQGAQNHDLATADQELRVKQANKPQPKAGAVK